jgi:hypothetical protein
MTGIVERIHGRLDKGWRRVTFEGSELDEILQVFAEVERLKDAVRQMHEALTHEHRALHAEIKQLIIERDTAIRDIERMAALVETAHAEGYRQGVAEAEER